MRSAIFLLLSLPSLAFAQVGKPFPTMPCEHLDGPMETLPTSLKGKHSIVILIQSLDAEEELIEWVEQIYFTFLLEADEGNFMVFEEYDINFRVVPMIAGLKKIGYEKIRSRMAEDLDEMAQEYVSLYKGSLSPYDTELGLKDKDAVYLFVLDPQGKVIHATYGPYTEPKFEALNAKIPAVE